MKRERYVILHNVRSAHNVGSIFRTSDGAGVKEIVLTGYTPTPVDRFGRRVAEIEKTSLGATETVRWSYEEDIFAAIDALRKRDIGIVAVEQTASSQNFKGAPIPERATFIFGNEVGGVSENVCNQADCAIEIPMAGKKESLNVSVAAGIILFHDFN